MFPPHLSIPPQTNSKKGKKGRSWFEELLPDKSDEHMRWLASLYDTWRDQRLAELCGEHFSVGELDHYLFEKFLKLKCCLLPDPLDVVEMKVVAQTRDVPVLLFRWLYDKLEMAEAKSIYVGEARIDEYKYNPHGVKTKKVPFRRKRFGRYQVMLCWHSEAYRIWNDGLRPGGWGLIEKNKPWEKHIPGSKPVFPAWKKGAPASKAVEGKHGATLERLWPVCMLNLRGYESAHAYGEFFERVPLDQQPSQVEKRARLMSRPKTQDEVVGGRTDYALKAPDLMVVSDKKVARQLGLDFSEQVRARWRDFMAELPERFFVRSDLFLITTDSSAGAGDSHPTIDLSFFKHINFEHMPTMLWSG